MHHPNWLILLALLLVGCSEPCEYCTQFAISKNEFDHAAIEAIEQRLGETDIEDLDFETVDAWQAQTWKETIDQHAAAIATNNQIALNWLPEVDLAQVTEGRREEVILDWTGPRETEFGQLMSGISPFTAGQQVRFMALQEFDEHSQLVTAGVFLPSHLQRVRDAENTLAVTTVHAHVVFTYTLDERGFIVVNDEVTVYLEDPE